MKLSSSLVVLASAASASAEMIRSISMKRALMSDARRLNNNANNANNAAVDDFVANNQYGFLSKYDLKLISCLPNVQYTDANGNVEYSSILFRLCPSTSCSDSISGGCKSGYGDYVVGINTYTQLWLEDKREDWQGDDNFKVEDYAQCRQYDFRQGGQNDDQTPYYVGPTCSADNSGVELGFFTDNTCTTVSTVSFESKSNGWTLPYSTSNLVTNSCEACGGYNANGQYAVDGLCAYLWEDASSKCETGMAVVSSQSGADTAGCDAISTVLPKSARASTGHAGAAIGWTFFALVIIGGAGYAYATWWMKRKQATSGLAADGVMN